MNAIEINALTKKYRAKVKPEGLAGSFRSLIKPEYREVTAVDDLNLIVPAGEIAAFIGPNGAGKSTTIKMLCGILTPTGGDLRVLGHRPIKDRAQLAPRIGTVFGQKSQLWLHLPAQDSFTLLAAIYDIPKVEKDRRVKELSGAFELGDFLTTPVRKLSLGQRIRCEVAASLLHDPDILFLDEPTIGLDVVVKQTLRELIIERNRQRGTTVFLTSHDPGDIERLCRRAIVIDHGKVIIDTTVERMKSDYLHVKLIRADFESASSIGFIGLNTDGIKMSGDGARVNIEVDTRICPISAIMQPLIAAGVSDITVSDPPMEDIIAAIFRGDA